MTTVVSQSSKIEAKLDDIQGFIDRALQPFISADSARALARNDATLANEKTIGVRETVLTVLAREATRENWSESLTADAINAVVKNYKANDPKKAASIATFKSEIVLATKYSVRGRVADIFKVTREAFEDETVAAKDVKDRAEKRAKSPIRTAFSRAYHTAIEALRAAEKQPRLQLDTVEDVASFAASVLKSRRIDYVRVKAQLDKIRGDLESFFGDFPVDGLQDCVDLLKEIGEADLKDARARMEAAQDADDAEDTAPEDTAPEDTAPQNLDEQITNAMQELYAA